jgi:rod shape-determining protein MreC
MVAIPSRHKSLVLLTVAVLAQVLLLAVQIKQDRRGRLIRVWTVAAVSPFERAGAWCFGRIRGTWNHYFALRGATQENEDLRKERDALKLQLNQLQSRAEEADRLAALLNFRRLHTDVPMLPARVIGASADSASLTIYIDRGEHDGVRRNMGVITADGVVGKVIEAYSSNSQVLLVTDKESGVGAMVAGSRVQSPVGGAGEPTLLMKYVSNDETVNVGDRVVTSGMDRIFPKDVPLGTVVDVKPGNPFKVIRLKPAARLERMEEVIVLLTLRPLEWRPAEAKKETEPPRTAPPKSASADPPAARP